MSNLVTSSTASAIAPDGASIVSEQVHQAVAHATLSVLPNVRHITPVECPAMIAEKILELMRR